MNTTCFLRTITPRYPAAPLHRAGLLSLALSIGMPSQADTAEGITAFDAGHYAWAYAELWLKSEGTGSFHAVSSMMGEGYAENTIMVNKDSAEESVDPSQDEIDGAVQYNKDEAVKYYKKGRYKDARKILEPLAAEGDKDAQALLGVMYLKGQGVSSDTDKAIYLLERAEQKGSARVAMLLSRIYVEQGNENDAKEILAKYAHENPAIANMMAEMYRYGKGFTRDLGRARYWYQVAAESGYAPAKRALEKIGYPQSED